MIVRQAALSFAATLAPGEVRDLVVTPEFPFRGERLTVEVPPQEWWDRLVAYVRHVRHVPRLVREALVEAREYRLAVTVSADPGDLYGDDGYPLRPPPPWWRRLVPPFAAAPVVIESFRVGAVEQTSGAGVPAAVFSGSVPLVLFDAAPARSSVCVRVRSTSRKPYVFRAVVVGTSFEPDLKVDAVPFGA